MLLSTTKLAALPTTTVFPAGTGTELAWELDLAMASDDDARARYLALYGTEWVPLCGAVEIRTATPSTLDCTRGAAPAALRAAMLR